MRLLAATLPPDHVPTIEEIQDAVEKILIENGHAAVAKAYILYRDEAARRRAAQRPTRRRKPSTRRFPGPRCGRGWIGQCATN